MNKDQVFRSEQELQEYIARVTGQAEATKSRVEQFGDVGSNSQNPLSRGSVSLGLNTEELKRAYGNFTDDFKGLALARFVRAKATAVAEQLDMSVVLEQFDQQLQTARSVGVAVRRALQENGSSAGLVQTMYGEFVELLREDSVVRKSGVKSLPMPTGNVTLTRQTAPTTGYYTAEGVPVTQSDPQFAQVRIFSKEITAELAVSNSLLRHASPELDVLLRDDLVKSIDLRSDLAFIRGDGTLYTPTGIKYQTASGGKFNSTGTTATAIGNDLENARLKLRAASVPLTDLVWYMSPRSESALRKLRDGNNNYIYKGEMDNGLLLGHKYYVTTQIPENLGVGGNESEVYLVATSQHLIFDDLQPEIKVYDGGAYSSGGSTLSGISRNETVIKIIAGHDFFQRNDRAAAVIQQVTWA